MLVNYGRLAMRWCNKIHPRVYQIYLILMYWPFHPHLMAWFVTACTVCLTMQINMKFCTHNYKASAHPHKLGLMFYPLHCEKAVSWYGTIKILGLSLTHANATTCVFRYQWTYPPLYITARERCDHTVQCFVNNSDEDGIYNLNGRSLSSVREI